MTNKICPFMSNQNQIEDVSCYEEKCGIWNPHNDECALRSLENLAYLKTSKSI